MNSNKLFINRELSWLSFNERVLQEAQDETVPLIQRLKFLGIFSNNLDEFFRVRVATVARVLKMDKSLHDSWEEDPKVILHEINKESFRQQQIFEDTFKQILLKLKKEKIVLLDENQLSKKQGQLVREYFNEKVRPTLVPLMLKQIPVFPQLRDDVIYLAVKLHNGINGGTKRYSLIEIPVKTQGRFYVIPQESDKKYVILLDDVIRYCLDTIFSNFDFSVREAYTFKITRDAEFDVDNDIEKGFLDAMRKSIKKRKKGEPVRFVYDEDMPGDLLKYIKSKLKINDEDTKMPGIRYHNFKDFINFPELGRKDLVYRKQKPISNKYLDENNSLFKSIARKDVMLYFPYQPFNYIIDFLRESAIDPKVKSIKMSLYRVASESNIINALVNAAKNGKEVIVIIELFARFDENANISWAKKLESEGVKVVYGLPGFKVHGKMILVERNERSSFKRYANISTGNFNESTAKIYCDHSLFTADKIITEDVSKVFDLVLKRDFSIKFKELLVSPVYLRSALETLINTEIENTRKGKESYIYLKVNNLVDHKIISKLYEASEKGVKVKIIVRGMCSLIPNKNGLSENIEAISIVDKYLEHSRFYIFANNNEEKVYVSSADLMTRNLDSRVEVTTPIKDEKLKKEVIHLFENQWNDGVKSRSLELDKINDYRKIKSKKHRHQTAYYNYLKSRDK